MSQPTTMAPVFGVPGMLRVQNAPPNLIVHTTPNADYSTNPPTISGAPPLNVRFGLCQSDDPDPTDSLNWQLNFGDSGVTPFNPDGSFNVDTDHVCGVDHTYREGSYTAWVSVTDKHLDGLSNSASSLARKSQAFTIKAELPHTNQCPALLDLDGPASGFVDVVPGHRYYILFSISGVPAPGYPFTFAIPFTPQPYFVPSGYHLFATDVDCGN